VTATCWQARSRVLRNIGLAFVRLGQYQDAQAAFGQVMEAAPEVQVGGRLEEGGQKVGREPSSLTYAQAANSQ
jgi:hypothetical protein